MVRVERELVSSLSWTSNLAPHPRRGLVAPGGVPLLARPSRNTSIPMHPLEILILVQQRLQLGGRAPTPLHDVRHPVRPDRGRMRTTRRYVPLFLALIRAQEHHQHGEHNRKDRETHHKRCVECIAGAGLGVALRRKVIIVQAVVIDGATAERVWLGIEAQR